MLKRIIILLLLSLLVQIFLYIFYYITVAKSLLVGSVLPILSAKIVGFLMAVTIAVEVLLLLFFLTKYCYTLTSKQKNTDLLKVIKTIVLILILNVGFWVIVQMMVSPEFHAGANTLTQIDF